MIKIKVISKPFKGCWICHNLSCPIYYHLFGIWDWRTQQDRFDGISRIRLAIRMDSEIYNFAENFK